MYICSKLNLAVLLRSGSSLPFSEKTWKAWGRESSRNPRWAQNRAGISDITLTLMKSEPASKEELGWRWVAEKAAEQTRLQQFKCDAFD